MATEIALQIAEEASLHDIPAAKALRTFAKILPKLAPETLSQAGEIATHWSDLTLFSAKVKRHKGTITSNEERIEESISGALAWLGSALAEADIERTPVRVLIDSKTGRWQ